MKPKPRRVRKAGAPATFTNEELRDIVDPVVLSTLTQEQRHTRIRMRKLAITQRRQERKRAGIWTPGRHCTKTKVDGSPCGAWCVLGTDMCAGHADAATQALFQGKRGKPLGTRKDKAPIVMRQVVEASVEVILRPYLAALGLAIEGFDEVTGLPIVVEVGGGIMIHGESKDGDIVMTDFEDLGARVAVAEKLIDRVYGKSRQTTVLEGGVAPIKVQPVRTEDRAKQVADLLSRSGAIPAAGSPHVGRRRRTPAKPTDLPDRSGNA